MNALAEITVIIRMPTAELLRFVLEHESLASLSVSSAPALLPVVAEPPAPRLLPAGKTARVPRAERKPAAAGNRPKVIDCVQCGKAVKVKPVGKLPRFCSLKCKANARCATPATPCDVVQPPETNGPRRPVDPLTTAVSVPPDTREADARRRGERAIAQESLLMRRFGDKARAARGATGMVRGS